MLKYLVLSFRIDLAEMLGAKSYNTFLALHGYSGIFFCLNVVFHKTMCSVPFLLTFLSSSTVDLMILITYNRLNGRIAKSIPGKDR